MNYGLNARDAVALLRDQLQLLLDLLKGGEMDLRSARVPCSVLLGGFEVGQSHLSDEMLDALIELSGVLRETPAIELDLLLGRASQTGGDATNDQLSADRAEAVFDALVSLDVSPLPRVYALGSEDPLEDLPGHESAVNRSVELRLWYDLSHHFAAPAERDLPGDAHDADVTPYEQAWEQGFRNLSDAGLEALWQQMRDDNLEDYEDSVFHDYFVTTIVNTALERSRRMHAGATLQQKVAQAWNRVQLDLREGTGKADRMLAIYRDAERLLELANSSLQSGVDGARMFLGQVILYDPVKYVAWGLYDYTGSDWALQGMSTTEDYPSRAGGLDWTLSGFFFALQNRDKEDLPPYPLPDGMRERVQAELLDN